MKLLIIRKKPTGFVGNMTESGINNINQCIPIEDVASSIDIEFEGKKYKTMVGYHDYLTRSYGDYMQLPPEDQRDSHHFKAWWL